MAERRVALIAAGMSRFGATGKNANAHFSEAYAALLDELTTLDLPDEGAGVAHGFLRKRLGEAFIGSLGFGGSQLGNPAALLMEHVGLAGVPARRVENACASSGFAIRDAVTAVESGRSDLALAGGVEVMNDVPDLHRRYWLGVSGDTEWERTAGLTFPGVYALMAARHMHEHGTTREHLAAVAVKNHDNGALNPKAQFQKKIDMEKALGSPTVCDPLGLFDCCSTTDGAAVALFAEENLARELVEDPIWVIGSGAATDTLAIHDRDKLTEIPATQMAKGVAFFDAARKGNLLSMDDIQVAEVHDCFTIAELLALEDLGICSKGDAGEYTAGGATRRDSGEGPAVNPSGGLKSKGHPLGATGAAQTVEIYEQLRGKAGDRQVPDARTALTHNVGGSGATCAVHLFTKEEA